MIMDRPLPNLSGQAFVRRASRGMFRPAGRESQPGLRMTGIPDRTLPWCPRPPCSTLWRAGCRHGIGYVAAPAAGTKPDGRSSHHSTTLNIVEGMTFPLHARQLSAATTTRPRTAALLDDAAPDNCGERHSGASPLGRSFGRAARKRRYSVNGPPTCRDAVARLGRGEVAVVAVRDATRWLGWWPARRAGASRLRTHLPPFSPRRQALVGRSRRAPTEQGCEVRSRRPPEAVAWWARASASGRRRSDPGVEAASADSQQLACQRARRAQEINQPSQHEASSAPGWKRLRCTSPPGWESRPAPAMPTGWFDAFGCIDVLSKPLTNTQLPWVREM